MEDRLEYVVSNRGYVLKEVLEEYRNDVVSRNINDSFNDYGGVINPLYNPDRIIELLNLSGTIRNAVEAKSSDVTSGFNLVLSDYYSEINDDEIELEKRKVRKYFDDLDILGVLKLCVYDYDLLGYCAIEVLRNGSREVVGLDAVYAHTIRKLKNADGTCKYVQITPSKIVYFRDFNDKREMNYKTGEYGLNIDSNLLASEILFLCDYNPNDVVYGVSRYVPIIESLKLKSNISRYNRTFFETHGRPEFLIVLEGLKTSKLNKADLDDYLDNLSREINKPNYDKRNLLLGAPEGVTFNVIPLETAISDFGDFILLTTDINDEIIISSEVSPYRLNIIKEGSLGGSNAEESLRNYGTSTINNLQSVFNKAVKKIFKDNNFKFDFKLNKYDVINEKLDFEILKDLRDCGAISLWEYRTIYTERYGITDADSETSKLLQNHIIGGQTLKSIVGTVVEKTRKFFKWGKKDVR